MECNSSEDESNSPIFQLEPDANDGPNGRQNEENVYDSDASSVEILAMDSYDREISKKNLVINENILSDVNCLPKLHHSDTHLCQPSTSFFEEKHTARSSSKDFKCDIGLENNTLGRVLESSSMVNSEKNSTSNCYMRIPVTLANKVSGLNDIHERLLDPENLSDSKSRLPVTTSNNDNHDEEKNSNVFDKKVPRTNFEYYVPPFSFTTPDKKKYKSNEEYFIDLRLWLQQAFFWQSVTSAFPYHLATPMPPRRRGIRLICVRGQRVIYPPSNQQGPQRPPYIIEGYECKIPTFWKRIAAEFIDFMILFFVKIIVTYLAIEFFDLVDLDMLDELQKGTKLNYKQIMELTQQILFLELAHRFVVCLFETYWLQGGLNDQVGGATPGKSIMGLRVIYCDTSVYVREHERVVLVKPGTNLGLTTAFFRSLTKNFVIALLIPTSFAFIFFPQNRTGYDMICSTIVVEDPIVPNQVTVGINDIDS